MSLDRQPLVLVVNDDEAVRKALGFSLRLEGVEVHIHKDGVELLADRDLGRADCLIVQDRMPSMDGFELMENLGTLEMAAPVILLTSNATAALLARASSVGVRLVLEKPILDNALLEGLLTILDGGIHSAYVESRRRKPNILARS